MEGLRDLPGRRRYVFRGPEVDAAAACEAVRQDLVIRGARASQRCREVVFGGADDSSDCASVEDERPADAVG